MNTPHQKMIPLQDGLRVELPMSGTIATAGTKLTISERWRTVNGMHWLHLNQLNGKYNQEVCLRWVCKRYEGVYVVLEDAFSVLEPEQPPRYAIAEVVNRNTVRLMELDELQHTLPHIQAEIVGREIWSVEKRHEVFKSDIHSVFGDFRMV